MLSECKSVLVPFYVSELNYFLQVEKDPKPVAEILMEIMTTMHCDRKLVSLQELFALDTFMIKNYWNYRSCALFNGILVVPGSL